LPAVQAARQTVFKRFKIEYKNINMSATDDNKVFENLDDTQIAFMNEDMVILVDEQDKNVGKCSKKESHLNTRIEVLYLFLNEVF
jgi:chromosomal replication initiation ATPase DnaA